MQWQNRGRHADFENHNGVTPLLSQTAADRRPGGTPWESQPEGGRRTTSQPSRRPTGHYEPKPATTGPHIQVGDSVRVASATVRLRTRATKSAGRHRRRTTMASGLLEEAQAHWRKGAVLAASLSTAPSTESGYAGDGCRSVRPESMSSIVVDGPRGWLPPERGAQRSRVTERLLSGATRRRCCAGRDIRSGFDDRAGSQGDVS